MYLISVVAKDGLMERPSIFIAGNNPTRDGRLGPGDQLLEVEGVSLRGGGHR